MKRVLLVVLLCLPLVAIARDAEPSNEHQTNEPSSQQASSSEHDGFQEFSFSPIPSPRPERGERGFSRQERMQTIARFLAIATQLELDQQDQPQEQEEPQS